MEDLVKGLDRLKEFVEGLELNDPAWGYIRKTLVGEN